MNTHKISYVISITIIIISFIYIYNKTSSATPLTLVQQSNDTYKGAKYCLTCHPNEEAIWDTSNHSMAYSDPKFQDQWKALGSPKSCLQCHTTNYNPSDGTYASEGVTCEQCHGPGNTMHLDTSVTLCAKCHSGYPYPTYNEWVQSGPGHANATCNFCHSPHSGKLNGQNSTQVCGKCHSDIVNAVQQTKHGDANLDCTVCHMYQSPPNFNNKVPAITGHTFVMTSQQLDCMKCHNVTLQKHNVLGTGSAACIACHGDIHNLRLKLVNGTTYALNNPIALCGECHPDRLQAWEQGTHGSPTEKYAPCTECHNPHDPIIAGILTVAAVPVRQPAPPAPSEDILRISLIVVILFAVVFILRRELN
jgi:hypothetical protein